MIFKRLKILVMVFLPVCLFGQGFIVVNEKQNTLYSGVENPIYFALKSIKSQDVKIKVNRGILRKAENHLVYKNCTWSVGIIRFYAISKRTNKVVDSIELRLKRLPDPEVFPMPWNNTSLEGWYEGKNILLDSRGLRGNINREGLEDYSVTQIEIQEFSVTVTSISAQQKFMVNPGAIFTKEVTDFFENLQQNDIVTFSNIKVKVGCEDFIRTLKQKLVYEKQNGVVVRLESK